MLTSVYDFNDVSDNGYPALLDSLISKRMVQPAKQLEDSFPVRGVCVGEDLMATFDLLGSYLTPTKVFVFIFIF